MKKIAQSIFLSLALFACGVTPLATGFSFGAKDNNVTGTEVNSVKNDGSYVSVGELWNNKTRTFNLDNMRIMLSYMGISDMTLSNLKNVSKTPKSSADFYATTLSAGKEGKVTYVEKKESQNINVTLGGLEWTVTYMSQDKYGNPVVTLWLSNSTQDAFKDRAQDEGQYYGYANGGLYSDWAYDWYSYDASRLYPSAMYGTSYIRAVTLNNGGKYAENYTTLSTDIEQSTQSAFALFTMSANDDGKDLVDYITTPNEMTWQEAGQSAKTLLSAFSYDVSNENWTTESDDYFYNSEMNFSNKAGYDTWKNDKLWLPSISEVGYDNNIENGIWKTNSNQRNNYDGNTTDLSVTVGTNNGDGYAYSWLRSGDCYSAQSVYYLHPTGISANGIQTDSSLAVRPALHLNLGKIDFERKTIFKSYDDLMVDNNISTDAIKILELQQQEVTDTEIDKHTNDGYDLINCFGTTYHILTERGFLYITNNSISKIPLSNKNLILHTDVYLNDEKFDKNGNVLCDSYGRPLYGDNVVYAWEPITQVVNINFNGCGHTIYGMYFNDSSRYDIGLFDGTYDQGSIFSNLNMRQSYITGDVACYSLKKFAKEIRNCVFSGNIYANGWVFGACQTVDYIYHCENYVNVTATNTYASGLSSEVIEVVNCKNFGNVSSNGSSGGIVARQAGLKKILNCENYGKISIGINYFCGGIIGALFFDNDFVIENCINYGKIIGESSALGGIVGYVAGVGQIKNCKNYGIIDSNKSPSSARGEIIGEVSSRYGESIIKIINCLGDSPESRFPLIGNVEYNVINEFPVNIDIRYSTIYVRSNLQARCLIGDDARTNISVQDCIIVIDTNFEGKTLKLFSCKHPFFKGIVKNLLVKDNFSNTEIELDEKFTIQSTIITYKNGKGAYYGTNFRDFYVSWKYGAIGLKTLDGVGSAQGSITTAWLEENGYAKKG